MLTTCPECELQVSDRAFICPHCGFPLKTSESVSALPRKKNKHKRLPNGFGQISEIKNRNLRNPFRVMVTIGKTSEGKPICKPLQPQSYFKTYNDAYAALIEYNKSPFDLSENLTMQDLFDRWYPEHTKNSGSQAATAYKTRWAYLNQLHSLPVRSVRIRHLRAAIDNAYIIQFGERHDVPRTMKPTLKSLLNILFDYAVERELTDQNYARQFSLDKEDQDIEVEKEHIPYTNEEVKTLWENKERYPIAEIILIQMYSGWRPQELIKIRLTDIDIQNKTITTGLKTAAGKNRVVPIHSKIYPLVKKWYDAATESGSRYLFFTCSGKKNTNLVPYSYSRYYRTFTAMRNTLDLNELHRPHDGRVQFVTNAKKADVDTYAVKKIVGHRIDDVTEKSYTKVDIEWLRKEIEKIP